MPFSKIIRRYISRSVITTVQSKTEESINTKWKYELETSVENEIQSEIIKPRHHPGRAYPKIVEIPKEFVKAAMNILEDQDHPRAQLVEDSLKFVKHLWNKKPPLEQEELQVTIDKLRHKIINRLSQTRADLLNDKYAIKSQLTNEMKKNVYNWQPVKYDIYNSLLYLVGRSAPDYAVLVKVFSEIKTRDPEWKPRGFFDFGSGIGMATWAANHLWKKDILEYFNVDSSGEMNELASLLLQGGRSEKASSVKGVYYRQFLPALANPYDLVISAYSLMELPSSQNRLKTIRNLWNKTTKYLVIVEQGTNAGYKVINEARDFILSLGNAHVFSPCPHDDLCPRFKLNDGTPCNFEITYNSIPFSGTSKILRERYSYIILKKGKRDKDDPQWPRLIRPTLLKHKHCICNLCTNEGKIEQAIFTASKYGKIVYRCAKASKWGDRLPVNIKESCQVDPQIIRNENSELE